MSTLHSLLSQVEQQNPQLAADLTREFQALTERRAFGLNFERHSPETVNLPGRRVRKGDKVRFLPERGSELGGIDQKTVWHVQGFIGSGDSRVASLRSLTVLAPGDAPETAHRLAKDLIVVAEFRDAIYPGLVSEGTVERGGDRRHHAVINAENYHALQALLYTDRGRFDAIYIDPPYNTGARDWKYNNDFVDKVDGYRHSKWLAFMERRLLLAQRLLRPDGVLILTIDENEHAHISTLLESTFREHDITSITIMHNPRGVQGNNFSYTHEYAIFVIPKGLKAIAPRLKEGSDAPTLRKWGNDSLRSTAKNCFYPIFLRDGEIVGFGDVAADDYHPAGANEEQDDGSVAVWPIDNGSEERKWRYARQSIEQMRPYLRIRKTQKGLLDVGLAKDFEQYRTVWQDPRLDASTHGTALVTAFAGTPFPYPKSLYAVYECLYAALARRPDAQVLDFFAGSGTTLHATMLLNTVDGGNRRCVLVTNNEADADEVRALRQAGLRPGDADYEAEGIFHKITLPRTRAAVTGNGADGSPLTGTYLAGDKRDWADGFEENVEFFSMTYEAPRAVEHNRAFAAVAPLLWLKAGAHGRRISKAEEPFEISDFYAVLFDLDASGPFLRAAAGSDSLRVAFIVTDDLMGFQMVCAGLPAGIEPVRLYESYLTNFAINTGRE